MRRPFIHGVVLAAVLAGVAAGSGSDEPAIVRVDSSSHRVFIVRQPFVGGASRTTRSYLNRLSAVVTGAHPDWGAEWSASFFTSRQLAGYKDEPDIVPYVMSREWSKGYVAEYTNQERLLVLYPLVPERRATVKVPSPK